MTGGFAQGHLVPDELLGPLRDSTSVRENGSELQRRLSADGYLFLRNAVNRADISAARGEVFERLAEVGEIRQPAIEGIATGESRRRELAADLGDFWQSVNHGPALRFIQHVSGSFNDFCNAHRSPRAESYAQGIKVFGALLGLSLALSDTMNSQSHLDVIQPQTLSGFASFGRFWQNGRREHRQSRPCTDRSVESGWR